MKQLRHIALIAALAFSGAPNDASAQAISNVLLPPQTIVGNLQGSAAGASALRICEVAVVLSQTGYLVSSAPLTCSTSVPPTLGTPGNAMVFGPAPTPNVVADAGSPPMLLAPVPAYTLKGNATGSAAVPTDVNIAALTTKASPAAGDYVLLSDQAASGALKKATVASVGSVSGVSSIAGNNGAFTLSGGVTNSTNDIRLSVNSSVLLTAALTNPTVTSSTTGVRMRFGVSTCRFTPTYSTRARFTIQGKVFSNTSGSGAAFHLRYASGAGPSNGTAVGATGTALTATVNSAGTGPCVFPFTADGIATGLTPATTYWFDIVVSASANTAAIASLTCVAQEVM